MKMLETEYEPIQKDLERLEVLVKEVKQKIIDTNEEIRKDLIEHEMVHAGNKTKAELKRLLRLCDREVPNMEYKVL